VLFALQSCGRRLQSSGTEPNIDIRQPLRSRKGLTSSTNDGCAITMLWSQGSGARFTAPRVHQIGALALASGRPLRSKGLAHSATLDPDPASLRRRLIGTRSRADQGWARLISQNYYTRVHTLHGAVLCSHPDILQWHRQYCRRLPSSLTHWNGLQGLVDVNNKAG